jgi:hypothetical protein
VARTQQHPEEISNVKFQNGAFSFSAEAGSSLHDLRPVENFPSKKLNFCKF